MGHAAPPTWARPELKVWLQPRPEGAAPVLPWPSLPPVPPSRGLVLHGALLWEGLCKQQAWRPARAVVPLPSGSSSDRLPQWRGRLAQGATGLPRFCWLARLPWPLLLPLPLPLPASAFASASCLLAACSFAHCGGGAGAVFGGGPFAAVGAPVTGGGLTAGGGNGTDGSGGGAGGAGEDAAAMGTEGGTGSVDGAGGAGEVRTRLGALGAAPSLGCRGLLDRAGLNGLASMTSPALKAPTPSQNPPSRVTAAWRRKLGPGPAYALPIDPYCGIGSGW